MPDIVNPYAMQLCELTSNASNSLLLNRKFPFSPSSNLYKQFRNLRKISSLKIVQSDKNSGLVALHVLHYDEMVQKHLSNRDIYELIDSTESIIWNSMLARVKRDHFALLRFVTPLRNQFPKNSIEFLEQSGSNLPTFHCIPKLHKPDMPGRPIVGSPSWLTTNWSILLDCLLETVEVQYALKNSINLILDLENFHMEGSYILCSADVASLYTNMSLPRLYSVIEQRTSSALYADILKFICENNFFRYGNDVYRQRDGIAMGTNCAVFCANLYLDAFDQQFAPKCIFYRRYIDDIFFILDTAIENPNRLQQDMNSFIAKISLEFSLSSSSVNFLDLVIYKSTRRKIQFRTFQKPQNIYQYLPRSSCHNPATIRGYIRGELIRFCRTNSTLENRKLLFNLFYQRLRARSFPISYLVRIFATVDPSERHLESAALSTAKRIPLIVPYYPNLLKSDIAEFVRFLNRHPHTARLGLDFFPAYRKNRNVLDLCSRSNISIDQIEYIAAARNDRTGPSTVRDRTTAPSSIAPNANS